MRSSFFIIALLISSFFGISQELKSVEEISPFHEGLAAVRIGDQWGFINTDGDLVIDFRNDLVWNKEVIAETNDITSIPYPRFKDDRCMIMETLEEEGIDVYGFINSKGETVITPEYLNVTEFDQGFALGILLTKTFRGQNRFQLNIYDFKFSEVILDTTGDIMLLITQRQNILMDKRRYELPGLNAKYLSKTLMAVKTDKNTWELRKI
ncbi:MAG: WG repeat-containing protein, partial [Flavobacteriaceae bacterium]